MNNNIYNQNGLIFWTEREIKLRNMFKDYLALEIKNALQSVNSGFKFFEIEAPLLTPVDLINKNYTSEDIFLEETKQLVLRPETTPGTYAYLKYHIESQLGLPPICAWQAGKSFRREQDNVLKNMRLKEFYQQEFQCVYAADSSNDYMSALAPLVEKAIASILKKPTRLVESDRLPSYSLKTMDVEVDLGYKWMEVCSMSIRTDFPIKAVFQTKKGVTEKELRVFEIAIGLDRCVWAFDYIHAPAERTELERAKDKLAIAESALIFSSPDDILGKFSASSSVEHWKKEVEKLSE